MEGNNDITNMVKEEYIPKGWLGKLLDDLNVVINPEEQKFGLLKAVEAYDEMFKGWYNRLKNYILKKVKNNA